MLYNLVNKNTKEVVDKFRIDEVPDDDLLPIILAEVKINYCRTHNINHNEVELIKEE